MMQNRPGRMTKELPPQDSPTVFIVDDHQASRKGVQAIVEVLGLQSRAFASAEDFLQADTAGLPGCLVLDLMLEGISGEELLRQLSKSPMTLPAIIISAFADVPTAVRCMEYGAVTLLEKPCDDQMLTNAIKRAIEFDQEQREWGKRLQQLQMAEQILVEREREVLDRVIDGRLNKKIARELNISERTVENVRSRLMRKFDADNATELAAKYTELQWLSDFAHRIGPARGPHLSSATPGMN